MRPTVRLVVAIGTGLLAGVLPARAANDPGSSRQWNIPLIGADSAWSVGTGKGITIAVVDTGAHLAHEDLSARLVPGRNFVTPNAQPQDDNGHGTHVAGIAAATANNGLGVVGVAPAARIMPVKVLKADGSGTYTNAAAGIRWAVDNGAHVVNLSLGSTVAKLSGTPEVFVDAIRYAWGKGVLCVVTAGNDFVLSSEFKNEDAIVVSATTRHDEAALYSNGVGEAKWALAAPGGSGGVDPIEDVYSTYWPHSGGPFSFGLYEYLSGTSMAAPHVAGAVAVLRSLGLTPLQTVERLRTTAKDLGGKGRDGLYGDGRIDVAKAVAGLAPAGGGGTGSAGTGGGGGGGGGGSTSPSTTATSRRSGSSGSGTTTAAAGGSRTASTSTAGTAAGAPGVTQTPPNEPSVPDVDPVDDDDLGALGGASGSSDESNESTWPAAVLALAALAAAALAAARARRPRV